jgi:hypothetical protein
LHEAPWVFPFPTEVGFHSAYVDDDPLDRTRDPMWEVAVGVPAASTNTVAFEPALMNHHKGPPPTNHFFLRRDIDRRQHRHLHYLSTST